MKLGRRRQVGFTLIELLVVVAILLIIAGIGIPRLLAARVAAIESKAGSTTRTVANQVLAYNLKWGQWPAALSNLGGVGCDNTPPTPTASCLIDDAMASSLSTGYGQYAYTLATGAGFSVNADPLASSSASKHYYVDSALSIHYSNTAAASATDPTL